jgi:hypothetical protein
MGDDVGMAGELDFRFFGMEEVIGVDAVDDIHMMSPVPKGMTQAVEIHGVSTETVRGIEGRQVKKIERTHYRALTSATMLIICRAAASHVSRPAASRPASLTC